MITGSLVRTHSGASLVSNFASLSPASAWPKQYAQKRPKTPSFHFIQNEDVPGFGRFILPISMVSFEKIFACHLREHCLNKHNSVFTIFVEQIFHNFLSRQYFLLINIHVPAVYTLSYINLYVLRVMPIFSLPQMELC